MFCQLAEALEDFRSGRFLILVDDPDRENEGDLIVAAQFLTAEKVTLMLREACGMFHFATTEEHLARLAIPLITPRNNTDTTPRFGYPFDALDGVGTGVSAADRAATILHALRPEAEPADFVVPGHVLPLAAHANGLEGRQGHTEGSVEMARLAGLFPAAAMTEILTRQGAMARGDDLMAFARRIGCRIIDVQQIRTGCSEAA